MIQPADDLPSTTRLNELNDDDKLDRRSRNAVDGLISLTLPNILEHTVVRHIEQVKRAGAERTLLRQILATIAQA